MGDMNVLDFVKNVGRNVVTGGMYSLVKAGVDTVKTGNPSALLTQGLDIGMASTGNQLAVDLGGEKAGMAFNAAGGALGAAGAAGAFSSLPGLPRKAAWHRWPLGRNRRHHWLQASCPVPRLPTSPPQN